MGDFFFRARIPESSYLIGKTLARSTFREAYGLNVVAVEKGDGRLIMLQPDTVFETGDILVLEGDADEFRKKGQEPYLEILPCPALCEKDLQTISTVFAEAMLSPVRALRAARSGK
ncbi:MAG: TrkA C-terminal domain-containing protein [Marinilabiliales bacterium]|nr:TrkA C-terminal domain-containing protein [Marinilabiliales bacterium]